MKRAVVLGWDGVPPGIVFDELLERMPNLQQLLETSTYGPLRSTRPPITVPAWMSMMTGCDPGQLGLYGFRHRRPGNYKEIWIPDSSKILQPKLWDLVGAAGGKVVVLGIPPTYPPPKVNGTLVSGFLAPDIGHDYTYPSSFADRISDLVGEYKLDVFYRTDEKEVLREELFDMTEKRHRLAMHLLREEDWNVFVLMEVGPDRLHHGFWRYFDRKHHLHADENEYRSVFIEYYELLDRQLGEILDNIPEDVLFLLTSDHGAKGRHGAFCINQWLRDKGLLKLRKEPKDVQPFEDLDIDWKKTKAWAWGGYYARIFINVEGYERDGCVSPEEYENFRDELMEQLGSIRGPDGKTWQNIVDKPEEVYEECTGDYPDLMVYFDNLQWRASSSMGHKSLYFYEDKTGSGPDDAVHDWDGIHVVRYPGQTKTRRDAHDILDIAPTVLEHMELEIPNYMTGKPIRRN